jgi:hypothetical protein
MSTRGPAPTAGVAKKVGAGVVGGVLLIAGVALLVLPGPGLLLVLAGLLVLASAFPAAQRFVADRQQPDPVRKHPAGAAGRQLPPGQGPARVERVVDAVPLRQATPQRPPVNDHRI